MEADNQKPVVQTIPTKQVGRHAPEWADGINLNGKPVSKGYITDSILDDDPTDEAAESITIESNGNTTDKDTRAEASKLKRVEGSSAKASGRLSPSFDVHPKKIRTAATKKGQLRPSVISHAASVFP